LRAPRIAVAALAVLALAGCQRPRPWPARIVLSLSGAAGRPVHGIDLTVALPAGTTVAHDRATGRISSEALSLGAGAPTATLDGRYVAHLTTPFVRILLASREPMRDGEVAVVTASVLSAVTPPLERFEVVRSAISGADGATLPGAAGWVSAIALR
jgi:hypothetical protein